MLIELTQGPPSALKHFVKKQSLLLGLVSVPKLQYTSDGPSCSPAPARSPASNLASLWAQHPSCPPQRASEAKKPRLNIHSPSVSREGPKRDEPSVPRTCKGSLHPLVTGHERLFTERYHTVSEAKGTSPNTFPIP